MVERDLADGSLVEITLEDAETGGFIMPMFATYRTDSPPGPAGRWLIDQFKISGLNENQTYPEPGHSEGSGEPRNHEEES
ncbi:MAG TPA: hypothetical protein VEK14_08515, partial [Rhodomicrobium sp.]|nr:hypothetical protein [Rhodomicrobium sp.]